MDPLRLYPRRWRARYGDEMAALLQDRPPTSRDRMDLLRGAVDAWLHPPTPSLVPPIAALIAGGLWTMLATIVLLQPVPVDWPGYVLEVVPLAFVAVIFLAVAVLGLALRLGDGAGRAATLAAALAVIGYVTWAAMLAGTMAGIVTAPTLGASQTLAMLGTASIGILLVRAEDEPIGAIVATAPILLIIPSTLGWLAFGTMWTIVGLVALVGRVVRIGPAGVAG